MAFKAILLCASALLVQTISAQTCGYRYSAPSCGCSSSSSSNIVAISSDGGSFIITSIGPVVPSGIAVSSDIALNGNLDVVGTLPFLSAVAFEGAYQTSGSAGVSYGCGDGEIGIQNVVGGSSTGTGRPIGLAGISGCSCGN